MEYATHSTASGRAAISSFQLADGLAACFAPSSAANRFASPSSASISATNPRRGKLFFRAFMSLAAIFAVSSGNCAADAFATMPCICNCI